MMTVLLQWKTRLIAQAGHLNYNGYGLFFIPSPE
jgi:hypothetical protein